jgi:hypothetical protein
VFRPKAMHRVAESEHGPHSSESLVCAVFDMLPECESTIKEEAQVPPSGSWVKAKFRAPLAGDPIWRLQEFVSGEWNPAYSLLDMLCHDRPARPS